MKIKLFLAAAFTAASLATSSFAQPANMAAIASKKALEFDTIHQVRSGVVQISSPTLVGGTIKKTLAFGATPSAASISAAIDSVTNVGISLANPSDYVNVSVSLLNAAGEEVFSGGGGAQSTLTGTTRTLPTIENNLWLAYEVKVPVGTNVVSATMILTDPVYGYTRGIENPVVSNGVLVFRSSWAGQGRLVLRTSDGTDTTYDLRTDGTKVANAEKLTAMTKSAFPGIFTATNPTVVIRSINTYNGQGDNESYEFTMTSMAFVKLTVVTSEKQTPLGYMVRFPGQTWQFRQTPETNSEIQIQAPVGVTEAYPVWLPEDLRPYDDNGKGG